MKRIQKSLILLVLPLMLAFSFSAKAEEPWATAELNNGQIHIHGGIVGGWAKYKDYEIQYWVSKLRDRDVAGSSYVGGDSKHERKVRNIPVNMLQLKRVSYTTNKFDYTSPKAAEISIGDLVIADIYEKGTNYYVGTLATRIVPRQF